MSVNPFLQSPYQAIIDKQDDEDAKPLIGSQAVKDSPLPTIPASRDDGEDDAPDAAPAPVVANPKSLLPPPDQIKLFETAASYFKVPANLLMAISQQESSHNPNAVNPSSGASGQMGYMQATAKSLGIDPHNPYEAIPAAAQQLRERLDKGMSIEDAVKEHFAGPNRDLWKGKTAKYGQEVLAKAGQIGQELYGDDVAPQSGGTIDLGSVDPSMDLSGAGSVSAAPQTDMAEVKNVPLATKKAVVQAAKAAPPNAPTSMIDRAFDNIMSSAAGGLHAAVGGVARLIGKDDEAKESDRIVDANNEYRQAAGYNDGVGNKALGIGGGVLPALALPEGAIAQIIGNAGLFAKPAFDATYKKKLAEGYSNDDALLYAAKDFGLNLALPMAMTGAVGKILGKGATEINGIKDVAKNTGIAAAEGAGFSAANTLSEKALDSYTDHPHDTPYLDPEDMLANALPFAAHRAVSGSMHTNPEDALTPQQKIAREIDNNVANTQFTGTDAVARNLLSADGMDPNAISPQDTVRAAQDVGPSPMTRTVGAPPAGPLSAAINDAVTKAASLKAQGASVADQLRAIRPPEEVAPPAGPLDAAMQDAATQHADNPAPMPEQPAEAPQPPDLTQVPIEQLRVQLKQVAQDAARNPEQRQALTAEQKRIRDEIKARGDAAMENSKPAAEPLSAGPFDDMNAANKMMQRYATETGQPHEVVPQGEKFVVQPIGEVGNGIDAAGNGGVPDGRGRSSGPAAGVGSDQLAASSGTEHGAGAGGPGELGGTPGVSVSHAVDHPATANGASVEPAAVANPYKVRQFPDQARAEAFLGKQADGAQFEAVQTGQKRWQVQPRAAREQTTVEAKEPLNVPERPQVPEEAQASSGEKAAPAAEASAAGKAVTTLKTAREKHARQEEAIQKAAANIAARKTEKEQAAPQHVTEESPALTKQREPSSIEREMNNPTSWVLRNKTTGEVQMETSNPSVVAKLNTENYEAVPVLQHLQELNDPNSIAGKWARRPNQSAPAELAAPKSEARQAARSASPESEKVAPQPVAAEAPAPTQRLDHGELNIPGRLKNIDAELDKYKAQQEKAANAERKTKAQQTREDKARAKELFAEVGDALLDKHGDKFGRKKLANELDQMVKWEPAKFIKLAEKFKQEQEAVATPSEKVPEVVPEPEQREEAAPAADVKLSLGKTPNSAEAVTVKDGVVHIGDYPAQNYDTGEDVKVATGASPREIKEALVQAGAIGRGQKMFGLPKEEVTLRDIVHEDGGVEPMDIKDREEGDRRAASRGPDDRRTIEVDGQRRPIRDASGRLIAGGDFMKQMEFWRNFDGKVDEHGHPILDANDPRAVYDVGSLMRDNRAITQPPRTAEDGRGADQVKSELRRSRDAGEIDPATANFALWALEKSPSLARDLRVNVQDADERGVAGSYQPAKQVINLFRGNENPGTAMHEILHHSERMMPAAIQGEILKAWQKAYDKAYAEGDAQTRAALEDMRSMATDRDAASRVIAAFRDGTLKYGEHYQLSNPSEYWAVNATRLMSERHAADSWVAKAKNWLAELGQKVRGWLGLPSDAPILKALDSVLKGTGEQLSPKMLVEQMDSNAPELRDITAPREGDPEQPEVPGGARAKLAQLIGRPVAQLRSVAHAAKDTGIMLVSPMDVGSSKAKAITKDFIANMRLAQAQWRAMDTVLVKNFTEPQQRAMWEAADQENDLRREGKTASDKGINALPKDQREVVDLLHEYSKGLWKAAQHAGMVSEDNPGVHYWTPRMAARILAEGGVEAIRNSGGEFSKDAKKLRTSASSLKDRKYEFTSDSEEALKAKLGDDAAYVKNIRVMPMAMAELEKAIAGRNLVNQIKAHGQLAGEELVRDTDKDGFETFDHPALKKWHVTTDENGNTKMVQAPLYIRKDFVGPLKAVLKTSLGYKPIDKTYQALMELKGASMSVIMASPMTHNAVIWGKAMPSMISAMGWKRNMLNAATLGGYTYYMGHQWRQDRALVNEMIKGGLVPMSGRGLNPDIEAIGNGIKPGRSMVAKAIGRVGDFTEPVTGPVAKVAGKAFDAVTGPTGRAIDATGHAVGDNIAGRTVSGIGKTIGKTGEFVENMGTGDGLRKNVDTLGHFWHQTLLWDRVADMQIGMAVQIRNHLIDQGIDQYVATRTATHFANRYAGSIPQEELSQWAHAIANIRLFSKSFTGTNLGAMKDAAFGLPGSVQAQIREHFADMNRTLGKTEIEAYDEADKKVDEAQKVAKGKARTILLADFAAFAAITSLTQAYFKGQNGQQFLDDLKKRMQKLNVKLDKDNPLEFLGPTINKYIDHRPAALIRHPFDNLQMLMQTDDNPHGKQDRVRLTQDEHGNTYYMRLPTGKTTEEMKNATNLTTLREMLIGKESPLSKGINESWNNQNFFGRSIYSGNDNILVQLAKSAGHIIKSLMPFDDMVAAKNLATGQAGGDKVHMLGMDMNMDQAKLFGMATGLSVSKLTGGDAAAEMRYQYREQQQKLNDVMPDVKDAVMHGEVEKAAKMLQDAGQTPQEISRTMRSLMAPNVISKSRANRFIQHASPEEVERVSNMMQKK